MEYARHMYYNQCRDREVFRRINDSVIYRGFCPHI